MRDLPDSGQTSPSSSWVLLRPLLGTASTCLYRISSSSWASRQGLLFLEMPRHSPLLMDLDINDLFDFFFLSLNTFGCYVFVILIKNQSFHTSNKSIAARSCRCCRFVSVFHSLWPLRTDQISGRWWEGRCSGEASAAGGE